MRTYEPVAGCVMRKIASRSHFAPTAALCVTAVFAAPASADLSVEAPDGVSIAGEWQIAASSGLENQSFPASVLVERDTPPISANAPTDDDGEQFGEPLPAAQQLTIEQYPTLVTIQSATELVACDTAIKTQVTADDGSLAEQTCGWDGAVLVIELHAASFERTERYRLAAGGRQLVHVSETYAGNADQPESTARLQRVFERATK